MRLFLFGLVVTLCLGQAMAQRPLGTDVSGYQPVISWMYAKNNGVTYGWAKATESTGFVNSEYTEQIAGAKAAGIYIGSYHFARPSSHPNITGANSAESEAQFFWSVASNYVKAGGQYMIPMLDWEDINMTNQLSAATCSAWVNQWCNSVSNYAFANGIAGLKPVVYTGTWYSTPSATYSGLTTAVTGWPAWIAAYTSNFPQSGSPGAGTFPWSTWNFWQYADTNWTSGDSDVFNGTATTLTNYIVGGLGLPYFASQPSSRTADQGGSITFRALANGAPSLKYQWRFNGTNILNATNTTFALTNIASSNAGGYAIVVTNSYGSITSGVATLTVNGFFTPVFSDNFEVNSAASWTLRQSADTRVAFAYNYAGYGIPSAPNSIGGATKGVKFEVNVSAAAVAALSMSPVGQSFGGNYRLHYDLWMNQNGPFPAGGTGSTQHHTSGLGTSGNQVQWTSAAADGVWFATDGEGQATDTSATLPDWRAYIGTTLQSVANGVYVGGTESNIRGNEHPYYLNVFPGGTNSPATQAQSGGLAAGTIGYAWRDVVVNKTGNVIEWFIDGLKIASVTNTLMSSNIFIGYWDSFSSLSANTNLSFCLVDNLRVEIPAIAPNITSHPQPTNVNQGVSATFTVAGSGTPAPGYQWRFSGTNIVGATNNSYTRNNAQPADVGNYTVVLTNVAGSITSSPAALTVNVAPSISVQPLDVGIKVTSNALFSVTASGTPTPTYQWRFNGTNISGASGVSYTRSNAQYSDVGNYSVVVTNVAGFVISSNALLTILPAAPGQFQSYEIQPDGSLVLSLNGDGGATYFVETSTNLVDWSVLTNVSITGGTIQFNVGATTNDTQRYFRARSAP